MRLSHRGTRAGVIPDSACREIHNHRNAVPQNIDKVRAHGSAKPRGITRVVVDRSQVTEKQIRSPVIFAYEKGPRARRKAACQRRLTSGNFSAEKIQSWYVS